MILTWAFIGILAVFEVWFLSYLIRYHASIVERELSLEERIAELSKPTPAPEPEPEKTVTVSASYIVTLSDEMKFNSDNRIRRNAKDQLAFTLAHDIVGKIEPDEGTTAEGRKKYSYKLTIKQ